jgi:hypothetical protein
MVTYQHTGLGMRERLIKIIREALEQALKEDVKLPEDIAARIADSLLDGRVVLRSGRRIYDRLRERLLHNIWKP